MLIFIGLLTYTLVIRNLTAPNRQGPPMKSPLEHIAIRIELVGITILYTAYPKSYKL
jgi:hypothetical protein